VRIVYVIISYLLLPLLLAHIFWRGFGNSAYWHHIGERFGRGPKLSGGSIWVHAVSVGEVQAAAALVRSLRRELPGVPLVLTTVTPTGRRQARDLFGDEVIHHYAPIDISHAVKRFFNLLDPRLVIILETELWPNLYHECGQRKVPLVLGSARVSARSVKRYRLVQSLFKETLSHGVIIAAQSETDADRFLAMGANPERTRVTGNIKFDFELDAEIPRRGRQTREEHAAGRPVWIAASTHDNEEEIVLAAHRQVLELYPDALLILVPRHPERFPTIASLIEREGFTSVRRSTGQQCSPSTQVYLGDTMGELTMLYAAADVAFVGGSLVEVGGHNLLEPATLAVPVLTGPNTFNAEAIASLLRESGAATVVKDSQELAAGVTELLADEGLRAERGATGRALVQQNRGALEKLLQLLAPLLQTIRDSRSG
jgi:3-deoxy-D-manno-octulosonic-acid transferase